MANQSKSFKKLQDEWYAKLKATGFNDIEEGTKLKDYHSTNWNNQEAAFRKQVTEDYYDKAMEIFRRYRFKNPKERLVWLLHAQGHTVRDIEAKFEKMENYDFARLKKSGCQ